MFHWSEKIRKEFYNPQNVGELDISKHNVRFAEIKTPDGFTHMQLFIELDNETITDAKFKVLGCPCCIACLSYLTQTIIGQNKSILNTMTATDLIQALELPKERYSSALLVEDLLKKL